MKIGDSEIWIACDGEPLPEHSVTTEGDDEKQIACFIPSEAGKTFVVHFRNHGRKDTFRFRKRLDGTNLRSTVVLPGEAGKSWGVRVTPISRRPYLFSHLLTTDDDSSLGQQDNPELGTICFQVERVEFRPGKQRVPYRYGTMPHEVGPVHERSKKVGIHCVSFGEETQDKMGPMTQTTKINPDEGPVATFIFRYWPLALLQAQGIAPLVDSQRNAEPEADPSQQSTVNNSSGRQRTAEDVRPAKRARIDRGDIDVKPDLADFSDDSETDGNELDELKGQLQQILRKIDRMEKKKKKKSRKSSGGSGRVKKEEPGTSSGLGSGGVIDLTLSD